MHVKIVLIPFALATLTACASPLERCLNVSERSVKRIERAIETADANISRGYAIHRMQEAIVVPKHCFTEKGRKYRCDETEYHTVELPVQIDLWAEQQRRDALYEDLTRARQNAAHQSDQCFAAHPEA